MNPFKALYRLLARCFAPEATGEDVVPEIVLHITEPTSKGGLKRSGDDKRVTVPEVFTKKYQKVIAHDVVAREAVCLTADVAVLGNADVKGDSCITGNLLIAGDVKAKGSICVTGDVIVLSNAHLEGQVCVTGNAFVKGDLAVKGKLDVGGKLCVFGSKDIQPAAA